MYKKTELPLSSRVYKCDECNLEIDRDLNASINIREVGKDLLAYKNVYQGRNSP